MILEYRLLELDVVDSTNLEAKRIAKTNPSDNYVIWSHAQTNGRGRKNKSWVSSPGNLFMSILYCHNYSLINLSTLSLVVGVSLITSLERVFGNNFKNNISLKWPNDVLLGGKKIAGILVENISECNRNFLVIGIGINIFSYPLELQEKVTSIVASGYIIDRNFSHLINIIINNFDFYRKKWEEYGFKSIKQLWLDKAFGLNKTITVNYGGKYNQGIFVSIDDSGALVIRSKDDIIFYYSLQEVFFSN